MNKNLYMVFVLFLLSSVIAFSGTQYWDDGEIVRGTKINYALDEKLDQSGEDYVQLDVQSAFATSTAAVGTIYVNASGSINYLSTATTWLTLVGTTTGLVW